MNPTLMEPIFVILSLLAAWWISKWLAPRVLTAFLNFWRDPRQAPPPNRAWPEKNVTPPIARGEEPRPPYGNSTQ